MMICLIFHVNLLSPKEISQTEVEGENIKDSRKRRCFVQYLVKWNWYNNPADDTLEPILIGKTSYYFISIQGLSLSFWHSCIHVLSHCYKNLSRRPINHIFDNTSHSWYTSIYDNKVINWSMLRTLATHPVSSSIWNSLCRLRRSIALL
jgi:hypothetical protein